MSTNEAVGISDRHALSEVPRRYWHQKQSFAEQGQSVQVGDEPALGPGVLRAAVARRHIYNGHRHQGDSQRPAEADTPGSRGVCPVERTVPGARHRVPALPPLLTLGMLLASSSLSVGKGSGWLTKPRVWS